MYPRQYNSDLSVAFSHTEADLDANRRGYLTAGQLETLPFHGMGDDATHRKFGSAVRSAVTTIAGAIVAFAFFAFLQGQGFELAYILPPGVRPIAIGVIVVAVVASLVWLAYSAVSQTRATRHWEASRVASMPVETVTGRVQPIVDRFEGDERYYLEVGGRRLYTTRRQLNAFQNSGLYTLYYVTSTQGHWLVSAEDAGEEAA